MVDTAEEEPQNRPGPPRQERPENGPAAAVHHGGHRTNLRHYSAGLHGRHWTLRRSSRATPEWGDFAIAVENKCRRFLTRVVLDLVKRRGSGWRRQAWQVGRRASRCDWVGFRKYGSAGKPAWLAWKVGRQATHTRNSRHRHHYHTTIRSNLGSKQIRFKVVF